MTPPLSTTKAAQAKDNWEYETVLFVPVTSNSALSIRLLVRPSARLSVRLFCPSVCSLVVKNIKLLKHLYNHSKTNQNP